MCMMEVTNASGWRVELGIVVVDVFAVLSLGGFTGISGAFAFF